MERIETDFIGLYIIQCIPFKDLRGSFLKTFNKTNFNKLGLEVEYLERYYSISYKNVIRGMHFQTPPFDHIKLVNVLQGSIVDIVIDLRKNSPTYRKYFKIELNDKDGKYLYIPKGFAHGFLALEDNTIVEYNQTTEYNKDHDAGIHWNSFGYDWNVKDPIISQRDIGFLEFEKFNSPFL